jgi:hypothetical protein
MSKKETEGFFLPEKAWNMFSNRNSGINYVQKYLNNDQTKIYFKKK